jgi:cysteine dioxygenase
MSPVKSKTMGILRPQPLTRQNPQLFRSTERIAAITASTRTSQSLRINQDLLSPPSLSFLSSQDNRRSIPTLRTTSCPSPNPFIDLQNALSRHLVTYSASSLSPTLPELFSLLRNYISDPQHWSKYAHINASKQYTRNLVYEVPGLFNLLILVWTPGKQSPVHDGISRVASQVFSFIRV